MSQYKSTIMEMQILAYRNNGQCISTEYRGVDSKLTWKCHLGHTWNAVPKHIAKGHWCPVCGRINASKKRQTYSIDKLNEIAESRCGQCVSKDYLGYDSDHIWQCQDGHLWKAPPDRIVQGKWCPKCAKRKHFTEEKCRFIVEQLTGLKFPSNRKVLGNRQELDLYNASMKIAIEYHGIQHYKLVKGWHKDEAGFQQSQEMDQRKIGLCSDLSINLFIVSYRHSRKDEYLVRRIKEIIHEASLPLVKQIVNFETFYEKLSNLQELKRIAKQRDGNCISRAYVDCGTKTQFQCSSGHIFWMEPRHVRSGHWCNKCGNITIGNKNRKLSLVDAQNAAKEHGGKCLSTLYQGSQHKLKWECAEGHIWEVSFDSIRSGYWCKLCGYKESGKKKRISFESICQMVSNRGGKCISADYTNGKTKLEIECEYGHKWLARLENIKSGTWCPKCSYRIRVDKMNAAKEVI